MAPATGDGTPADDGNGNGNTGDGNGNGNTGNGNGNGNTGNGNGDTGNGNGGNGNTGNGNGDTGNGNGNTGNGNGNGNGDTGNGNGDTGNGNGNDTIEPDFEILSADSDVTLSIIQLLADTRQSGRPFAYSVLYTCSTIDSEVCAEGPVVRIPIDITTTPAIPFSDFTVVVGASPVILDWHFDTTAGELVFELADLPDGTSGAISFSLTPPNGRTPHGTSWTLQPTIEFSDDTPTVTATTSATSTATAVAAINSLVKGSASQFYRPGEDVSYTITYNCASPAFGKLDAETITVVDTLPAELEFVSATPELGAGNPEYDAVAHTVTWTLTGDQIRRTCRSTTPAAPAPDGVTSFGIVAHAPADIELPEETLTVELVNDVRVELDPIGAADVIDRETSATIVVHNLEYPLGQVNKAGGGPIRNGIGDSAVRIGTTSFYRSATYAGQWRSGSVSVPLLNSATSPGGGVPAAYRTRIDTRTVGVGWTIVDPVPCNTGGGPVYTSNAPGSYCADPAFHVTHVSLDFSATTVPAGWAPYAVDPSGTTIALTPLGVSGRLWSVPAGVTVAEVRTPWVPGTEDAGYSRIAELHIGGYVDDARASGDIIQNVSHVAFYAPDADADAEPYGSTPSVPGHVYVVDAPVIGLTKSGFVYTGAASPQIQWGLQLSLTTSTLLGHDLVLTDVFPVDAPIVTHPSWLFSVNGAGSQPIVPTITSVLDPATGRETVRWTFPRATLNAALEAGNGRGHIVIFSSQGPRTALDRPGEFLNQAYLTYADEQLDTSRCLEGTPQADSDDIDGIPATTFRCYAEAVLDIEPDPLSSAVTVGKWVRGSNDTGFVRYPGIGTVPTDGTGSATFRLIWTNWSAAPVGDVVLYDLLPRPGDTGTLQVNAGRPRHSDFTPTLVSVSAPGLTVEYSHATNPCRDEVFPNSANAGCTNDWSASAGDLSTVTALRFTSSATYAFGEGIAIEIEMTTPMIDANDVAWNTFAAAQTNVVTGVSLPPVESAKVGLSSDSLALLQIEKTVNLTEALPGQSLTYTLTVLNEGNITLTDVLVTDTLPPEVSYLFSSGSYDEDTGTVTWTIPQIAPGETRTFTIFVQVPATVEGGEVLVNRLGVSSPDDPRVIVEHPCEDDPAQSCAVTTVPPLPRLEVAKVVDLTEALPNDQLEYTITVSNRGTAPTAQYNVTDYLPPGVTYVSSTPDAGAVDTDPDGSGMTFLGWQFDGDDGVIEPGQSVQLTVRVTIDSDQWDATLVNAVQAAGAADGGNQQNASAADGYECTADELRALLTALFGSDVDDELIELYIFLLGSTLSCATTVTPAIDPAIELVKTASEPANGIGFVAGEVVTYSFEVTNVGNVPLTNVTVTEDSFVNGAGDPIVLDSGPTAPAGFDGTLALNESVTFTGTYTITPEDVDALGDLDNVATATGEVDEGYEGDDPSATDDETTPVYAPAIELAKTASDPADGAGFVIGEVVTYSFTVTNIGTVPLTNVTVTEDSFVNGAGDPIVLDSGPTAPAGFDGTLAPGESVTFTGTYTITLADVLADGDLDNVATATGTPPGDGNGGDGTPIDDSDDETVPVAPPAPAIRLVKTASAPASGTGVVVGEVVTYSFVVTNVGNVPLTEVTVTDDDFVNGAGDPIVLDSGPTAPAGFDGTLAPGESVTFTGTYTVTADDIDAGGTLDNIATVTGTTPDTIDGPVTDTSDESVAVTRPRPTVPQGELPATA